MVVSPEVEREFPHCRRLFSLGLERFAEPLDSLLVVAEVFLVEGHPLPHNLNGVIVLPLVPPLMVIRPPPTLASVTRTDLGGNGSGATSSSSGSARIAST